jgi:hypothetical protein
MAQVPNLSPLLAFSLQITEYLVYKKQVLEKLAQPGYQVFFWAVSFFDQL